MSTATKDKPSSNGTALATSKAEIVTATEQRIGELTEQGMLHLPPNYSAANALRAAWLILQETKDRNGKSVLDVCTRPSIANALLSMVVQGLDPNRNQAYFIAHGQTLTLRRSYFGTLALAKRLGHVRDAYAEVVYEGDEFEFEIDRGRKRVAKHKQTLESIAKGKIVAAYCVVEFDDDREPEAEVMAWPEIEKAWKKGNSTAQKEFPGEMAKRSVLNRALKRHINSSDDEHLALVLHHANRSEVEAAHDEVEAEAAEHANRDVIDIDVDTPQLETGDEPDEPEAPEASAASMFDEPEPEPAGAPF